ncbi:MAG: PEP-CTERM sorting domain-containing protein [Sedimentisphaerales bacterium]
MKTKSICMAVVTVMLVALQASAYVENWNYTLNQPLTTVSPWTLGYFSDTCIVQNWDSTIGNYVSQADGGFKDSVYVRQTNFSSDIQSGGPIIRLETSMFLGGSNSYANIGVGNYTVDWAHGPTAFTLRGKRFLFGIYDAAGTYYEDYNFDEYFHVKWWDVRVDIDPLANSGNGELDFYYKLPTETVWRQSTVLSNLNLHLKANAAIDDPYTEWKGLYARISRTEAGWLGQANVGSIELTSIPEPTTMFILGLGALTLLRRRVA